MSQWTARSAVSLLGNPLTMLLGLPALLWCLGRNSPAPPRLYAGGVRTLCRQPWFWIIAKPVQFYYHYLLPSCFLLIALALALDSAMAAGQAPPADRRAGLAAARCSAGSTSSAPPRWRGRAAFAHWMWLDNWR
ncbi:MAG: hypothetical protein R3E18_00270 [Sphingomonadaceae bacterium]